MKVGVLISGRGSNLRALASAIHDGRVAADLTLVVSNVAEAPGLAWARGQGLATACLPHREFADREAHERALLTALRERGVELVCLAGYMRLLGPTFLRAYPGRILNIHPSLLPAFPGLDAQAQALAHGVKVTGATVHIVDEGLDQGPILLQEAVAVQESDTVESLSARILLVEHRIYPRAVDAMVSGRVSIEGRRAQLAGDPA